MKETNVKLNISAKFVNACRRKLETEWTDGEPDGRRVTKLKLDL